ncbi:MAG: LysR family transcriptional regulator, partial [Mesorhizobium sp.]
ADGFGDIDSSNVVMHRNPNASGEAIDGMQEAIREAFVNRQVQPAS